MSELLQLSPLLDLRQGVRGMRIAVAECGRWCVMPAVDAAAAVLCAHLPFGCIEVYSRAAD